MNNALKQMELESIMYHLGIDGEGSNISFAIEYARIHSKMHKEDDSVYSDELDGIRESIINEGAEAALGKTKNIYKGYGGHLEGDKPDNTEDVLSLSCEFERKLAEDDIPGAEYLLGKLETCGEIVYEKAKRILEDYRKEDKGL